MQTGVRMICEGEYSMGRFTIVHYSYSVNKARRTCGKANYPQCASYYILSLESYVCNV